MRNDHLDPVFANLLNAMTRAVPRPPRIVEQTCPYCFGSGTKDAPIDPAFGSNVAGSASCAACAGKGYVLVEEIEA